MDDCVITLLILILIFLIIISVTAIIGGCYLINPNFKCKINTFVGHIRKTSLEKFSPSEEDYKQYNDKIFDPDERTKYYMGDIKDKLFIQLYNTKLSPEVSVVNSTILADQDHEMDNEHTPNNYIEEIRRYYRNFKRKNPSYRENQMLVFRGDLDQTIKDIAILAKSRPSKDPGNCALLPLNNVRHWLPVNQVKYMDIPTSMKLPRVVWRGATTGWQKRNPLVERYHNHPSPSIDIGYTHWIEGYDGPRNQSFLKPRMSISEQLKNLCIVSVEGNDVASNLKWILASNSVCIRPQTKIESWAMEGLLKPWVHYVPVKDDFSDLPDAWEWCIKNPGRVKKIIEGANDWVVRFMNGEKEFDVIEKVMRNYCDSVTIF